jgi:hypothetical protein
LAFSGDLRGCTGGARPEPWQGNLGISVVLIDDLEGQIVRRVF